jgi:hypothetical protein
MMLASFVDELRADEVLAGEADEFERVFGLLETEAVTNRHAWGLLRAISWVTSQPRTIVERLEAIDKVISVPAPFVGSVKLLVGW